MFYVFLLLFKNFISDSNLFKNYRKTTKKCYTLLYIYNIYFQKVQLYHLLEELRTLKKFCHLNKGLKITGIQKTATSNAKPLAEIYATITSRNPKLLLALPRIKRILSILTLIVIPALLFT